jgi:ribosome-associated toxin RatA of RatAB toxin-antitoxin module
MDISTERVARADPRKIFELAAAVEAWPRILPHYRWVRILASSGTSLRLVEMAAWRNVVGSIAIPLRWRALQHVHPSEMRIEFEHVGGITRGMRVTWTIAPREDSTVVVSIRHVFTPAWPVPQAVVRAVVGEYFVNGVARRTLRRICELAQRPS